MSDKLREEFIKHIGYERPAEPYSTDREPDQWARVLEWEESRGDYHESQLSTAREEIEKLKKARDNWKSRAEMLDRAGYEMARERDTLKARNARLVEGIKEYSEARRKWMAQGDSEVQQEVDAWQRLDALTTPPGGGQ